MKVRGIVWMGVQTERHDEMIAFMRRLVGAEEDIAEPGFALWALPDGSLVELFAGGTKPPFETAPVVGFRVDDLDVARRDLEAAGAEIVGGYGPNESGYGSIHFRAPDGNIYEVVVDPEHETRGRGR
jgi:catechol 2,3-dioxygenase-like lactoylglutathione lyase family enzyme